MARQFPNPGSSNTATRDDRAAEPMPTAVGAAISDFLLDPPPEIPPEVLRLLRLMFGTATDSLPPRIYFETVEHAPVAISITDADARILYVNAAFEHLTGYARNEVIGKNQSILSSRSTPEAIYLELWDTILDKRTWTGNLVNRRKGGDDYLAELVISPVLDDSGQVAYFLGMHRDMTHEHELSTALHRQMTRIENVLNAAPAIVVLLDSTGRRILDNLEYQKLRDDLQGEEPLTRLCRALREQAGFNPLERLLPTQGQGEDFQNIEISLDLPGGLASRWLSCSGTQIREQDGSARNYFGRHAVGTNRLLLLLATDVTLRHREIERAYLESLRARMAEQQLSQGMREALAAARYQIESPLNLLRAASAMFANGVGTLDNFAPTLAQIISASEQALQTLQAAIPDEAVEIGVSVNVNDLLRHVLTLETNALLVAGVVVDWKPAMDLPSITGRETELRSLFKNLIDNAVQAIREGNRDHRELRIVTRALTDAIEILIEDSGPGFPPDARYRAFEPFYIGWRNRRGHSGMGLTLAQEIANEHGGSIEIDPEFTDGCRVRMTLTHLIDCK